MEAILGSWQARALQSPTRDNESYLVPLDDCLLLPLLCQIGSVLQTDLSLSPMVARSRPFNRSGIDSSFDFDFDALVHNETGLNRLQASKLFKSGLNVPLAACLVASARYWPRVLLLSSC